MLRSGLYASYERLPCRCDPSHPSTLHSDVWRVVDVDVRRPNGIVTSERKNNWSRVGGV